MGSKRMVGISNINSSSRPLCNTLVKAFMMDPGCEAWFCHVWYMILDCQFMYALPLDVMTPCKHRGISSYFFPVAGGCCGGFGGVKFVNFPATHGTCGPESAGFISLIFFSNFNQHAFVVGLNTHTLHLFPPALLRFRHASQHSPASFVL